jgi:O-antigen ligase
MLRIFDLSFATFGMFYMCEGFAAVLATPDDMQDPTDSGSLALRLLGVLIGAIATLRLAPQLKQLFRITTHSWVFWLPVCAALASMLWSGDPGMAARRSLALVLTTIFALYVVTTFDTRAMLNCLLAALLLYCVGSLLMIILVPSIGIHSATDTRFIEHVGAWRGLSPFKNDFGRIVALAGVLFIAAAVTRPGRRQLYVLAALLAAALVAGSRSGQAIALLIGGTGAVFYVMLVRDLPPRQRSALILLTIPLAVLALLTKDVAIAAVLEALGKDPTLTGRENIWAAVLDAVHDNLLLGGGYGAGWSTLVGTYMEEVLGRQIGHAHNGYLNTIVDVGVLGLVITLCFYLAIGFRILSELVRNRSWELVLFTSTLFIFIIVGNWVASFLMKYNSIFWVMMVCCYCKLYVPARLSAPSVVVAGRRKIEQSPATPGAASGAAAR